MTGGFGFGGGTGFTTTGGFGLGGGTGFTTGGFGGGFTTGGNFGGGTGFAGGSFGGITTGGFGTTTGGCFGGGSGVTTGGSLGGGVTTGGNFGGGSFCPEPETGGWLTQDPLASRIVPTGHGLVPIVPDGTHLPRMFRVSPGPHGPVFTTGGTHSPFVFLTKLSGHRVGGGTIGPPPVMISQWPVLGLNCRPAGHDATGHWPLGRRRRPSWQ